MHSFLFVLILVILVQIQGTSLEQCCEAEVCQVNVTGRFDNIIEHLVLPTGVYQHAQVNVENQNFAYASLSWPQLRLRVFDQEGYDYFQDPLNCQWDMDSFSFDEECEAQA